MILINNLFILTAASEANKEATRHFIDTIERGKKIEEIEKFLNEDNKTTLKNIYGNRFIKIWGATPGKENIRRWNLLKEGDYILIYKDSFYKYIANITKKIINEELSKELWGIDENKQTWKYIYFIDRLIVLDVPKEKFNRLIEYLPNYVPQGFTNLSDEKLNLLKSKFGSIKGFIENLIEEDIGKTFEDLEEIENLDDEKIERKIKKEFEGLSKEEKIALANKKIKEREIVILDKVKSKKMLVKVYERDNQLSAFLKEKYDGNCQICGDTFKTKKGINYAETHHKIPLGEKGKDIEENIIVVCPTCHKKLHYAKTKWASTTKVEINEELLDVKII